MENLERLYTLLEVAERLRVPLNTVRFWRSCGCLKVIKVGRHPLVLESDLVALVDAGRAKVASVHGDGRAA